jgi:hypothetical protein
MDERGADKAVSSRAAAVNATIGRTSPRAIVQAKANGKVPRSFSLANGALGDAIRGHATNFSVRPDIFVLHRWPASK